MSQHAIWCQLQTWEGWHAQIEKHFIFTITCMRNFMTSSYMSEACGLGIKAVAAATHLSILDVLACGGGRKRKKTMMSPRTPIFSTFRFFAPLDLNKLLHLPHTKQTFNIRIVCQSLFWFAYFFASMCKKNVTSTVWFSNVFVLWNPFVICSSG